MKKIITLFIITVMGKAVFAQQDAQFTQNMFNKLGVNPGYAGTNKSYCGTLFYRNQWAGFDGSPKTILFSGDAYMPKLHGGLGLTVVNDKLGFENNVLAKLAYSFNQPIGIGVLGVGIEGGMIQKAIKGDWIAPDGTTTTASNINDGSIPSNVSKTTYDIGFGVYYTTPSLYVGLSSTHIAPSTLKAKSFSYAVARHYYIMAGYTYNASGSLAIEPSVLVKSDAVSTQFDLNVRAIINNMFWAGLSYRLTDAIAPLLGYQTQVGKTGMVKIGYSYDVTTSNIKKYSTGSHEIMLGFCLKPDLSFKKQSHSNTEFMN